MKKLVKILVISIAVSTAACSKDDDSRAVVPAPSARILLGNNNALAIPDRGVAENSITVPNEGTIADASKVSIHLNLGHTHAGDLVIQLFAPSGEYCTLIKRAGGGSDFIPGNTITFNAAATDSITKNNNEIPTGIYLPTSNPENDPIAIEMVDLTTFFNGKSIKGVWKLRIGDYAGGDIGTLGSWKLEFNMGALK